MDTLRRVTVLQVGSIIGGRLRVDRLLGAGGMGVVVAATHLELDQRVAVKVLHDELAANPTIVARFLREARAVAKLRTEHVCRVFDVGRLDNGAPYIVMELLDGSDLGAAVVRGPVAPAFSVDYVIQACVALAEAHAAGVVHRDLKPANLFVTRRADGSPLLKVLDFGIAKAATAAEAKLTHTASTMGSPGYMSPEQIKSARDVDLRTDIWALGVTLFQLLSGRMPFAGTQLTEIAVNITTAQPGPLEGDPALRAIVMRCLEKEPERRYPDVASLATALRPFGGPSAGRFVQEITGASPEIVTAAPALVAAAAPTAASRSTEDARPLTTGTAPRGRRPGRWLVIAGLAAALVGGGLVAWRLRAADRTAAPIATVTAPGDAPPADATTVVVTARAPIDASDPWSAHAPPPPDDHDSELDLDLLGSALDDPPTAEIDAGVAHPAGSGKPLNGGDPRLAPYRAQMLQSLHAMDAMLPMLKNDPKQLQELAKGAVTVACKLGEPAIAQRWFDRLVDARERTTAVRECKEVRITLADHRAPSASGAHANH